MLRKTLSSLLLCSSVSYAMAQEATLIAPMLEGNGLCRSAIHNPEVQNIVQARELCFAKQESSAGALEDVLSRLGPPVSSDGQFELGYMIGLPLLAYVSVENGQLSLNRDYIRNDLKLLQDSERKAVVYLFANHFVSQGDAEKAQAIASQGGELMTLNDGTQPKDNYFSSSIYPWRVGDDSTQFYAARKLAMAGVLEEICALPQTVQQRIKALTTLGEVHHFFPNFKGGMGYGDDYRITDYSAKSVAQFRAWLAQKYDTIERLNSQLGAHFSDFDDIDPPAKDIRKTSLNTFFDHLDPYAHGTLPFFGWAYAKDGSDFDINVYLDGQFIDQAQTKLTRVDVAQAIEGLNESNVGYRYNLDFSALSPGVHNVELRFFHNNSETLLKHYEVAVVNRSQATPKAIKGYDLNSVEESDESIRFWADYPESTTGVFYNPLAKLWLSFREQQVTYEIEDFADQISQSCIASDKVFSHQIAPDFNPTWDPTLFAASDSLKHNDHYQLGINLYGGVIYSDFLFDWLKDNHHDRYGIPEMHPMLPTEPKKLAEAFVRHHKSGAVFLSPYFMSIVPSQFGSDPEHDRFKLDATNVEYGSDHFYKAIQLLMK